jgi:hypothetical protein
VRSGSRWEVNIKVTLKEKDVECGLGSPDSAEGTVVFSCEYETEYSVS